MKELFDLTGKVALVTGGTHGIGLSIAILLAKAGARLCVNDIRDEKLENCRTAFRNEGLDFYSLKFDVTDEADVDRAFRRLKKMWELLISLK
jgi:gluconate 5-dehydrogenase